MISFNNNSLILLFFLFMVMPSMVQAKDIEVDDSVIIQCSVSVVHLCGHKSCQSVPVYLVPEEKYPLKLNLKTHEVISLYDKSDSQRSTVLAVEKKSDRLEILGRAEKSRFYESPMTWLMHIYYKSGDMALSGTSMEKGVLIFGNCITGDKNGASGHVMQ